MLRARTRGRIPALRHGRLSAPGSDVSARPAVRPRGLHLLPGGGISPERRGKRGGGSRGATSPVLPQREGRVCKRGVRRGPKRREAPRQPSVLGERQSQSSLQCRLLVDVVVLKKIRVGEELRAGGQGCKVPEHHAVWGTPYLCPSPSPAWVKPPDIAPALRQGSKEPV